MKISLEQLVSLTNEQVTSLLSVITKEMIEEYVGNQMNQMSLLRANLNKALEKRGMNHIDDTIEVLDFIEGKLKLCQQIIGKFKLFERKVAAGRRVRPMSIAYAKHIIESL